MQIYQKLFNLKLQVNLQFSKIICIKQVFLSTFCQLFYLCKTLKPWAEQFWKKFPFCVCEGVVGHKPIISAPYHIRKNHFTSNLGNWLLTHSFIRHFKKRRTWGVENG
jgi:hypothetical protein